ncbi:formyltetrahydrofolate deformylase [Streptomyces albus]|uniref:Formyltetrahydrofolate deformylase n=1 Tax=Streptomyces albus (strain ATCC 21838 / DSM 41398 / FERM P-419 / JCM 4703 / NBRC 107858) TaxID=1081613 RepID=A0A0B5ERG6_STRA4|nr:formyltetrahydrofolate deformylase [Streptomyces albus]AOU76171.1 formyltetrahydrofolate deformylase [Streptomyces albus]AYN31962.1 formyltetrahydrofolate deformylase [Streptomyces albus]
MSPRPDSGREYVLTFSCPDRPGLVHAVSAFLLRHGGNILESQQFNDPERRHFFMRVQFTVPKGPGSSAEALRAAFARVAEGRGMSWELSGAAVPKRTLLMVSRYSHCLSDLLFRTSTGELNIDVPLIVSNHPDLAGLARSYEVPFRHIPVGPDTKERAEAELRAVIEDLGIEIVVLARYMQILSDDLCKHLEGRAINIHHSFLPSFKGARPYAQAHERGVKLVGATAHFVTGDLDEGPIIEQDVVRVGHALGPADLVAVGRDVEALVLARAVRWHAENRVVVNGRRTVVLR